MSVWYIGPESKVYHSRRDCPALTHPWRYWSCHEAKGKHAERIVSERRPCKRCH